MSVLKRPEAGLLDRWHVAVNRFHDRAREAGDQEHRSWMYDGKALADEVPRMAMLFGLERRGELPAIHQQCSHAEPEAVIDNHLSCCLGVECRACPELKALELAELAPEEIDQAKAWTCAAHIMSRGGDTAGEGFILTTDDHMYWQQLYANLAAASEEA